MRIDFHTHIFPPEVVADRGRYFDSEEAFELLYGSPKSRMVTAEGLIEAMERDQIDRSVVFGFPWHNPETAARHNDYVLDMAGKYSPKLIPLACVNPLAENSAREAQRCLEAGAAGLGELAIYGECDRDQALRRFQDLVVCCRHHRALLLVHANEPVGHIYPGKAPQGLDFYYSLAKLALDVDLILAHWGGGLGFYGLLKKEAPEVLRRVYYDTAASPFLYDPSVYALMRRIVGTDKVLFGSDYPLLAPERYFREMSAAGLNEEEVAAITGGNAMRLLRLAD